jgi:hypothetical protein
MEYDADRHEDDYSLRAAMSGAIAHRGSSVSIVRWLRAYPYSLPVYLRLSRTSVPQSSP